MLKLASFTFHSAHDRTALPEKAHASSVLLLGSSTRLRIALKTVAFEDDDNDNNDNSNDIERSKQCCKDLNCVQAIFYKSPEHRLARSALTEAKNIKMEQSNYVGPVQHKSFSTSRDGTQAASSLHSSFLQAIAAVMLWFVLAQEVLQASKHVCPDHRRFRFPRQVHLPSFPAFPSCFLPPPSLPLSVCLRSFCLSVCLPRPPPHLIKK